MKGMNSLHSPVQEPCCNAYLNPRGLTDAEICFSVSNKEAVATTSFRSHLKQLA